MDRRFRDNNSSVSSSQRDVDKRLPKTKEIQKPKKLNRGSKKISVLRDSSWVTVHPKVLLVGDIVRLENGVTIPADGVLISSFSVEVVESALTGENETIKKQSFDDAFNCLTEANLKEEKSKNQIPSPVVLSGTNLAEGQGTMLVLAVGKHSVEGRLMELAGQAEEETPLMQKLHKLTTVLSKFGIICGLVTVVALYLRFGLEFAIGVKSKFDSTTDAGPLVKFFITGITVLVVAIPEGLPLAVTISLAYSVKKMQQENNLVRKLNACETMGGADIICSDKTGTLTQNKMSVDEMWAGDVCYSGELKSPDQVIKPETIFLIKEAIFLNSSAYIDPVKGEQGSKSEIALIRLMIEIGFSDYKESRQVYLSKPHKIFPFSSKRKRSSIIISKDPDTNRVHLKGAAEIVIGSCKDFLNPEGKPVSLDSDNKKMLLTTIQNMTNRALRVIALAFKDISQQSNSEELNPNGFPAIENSGFTLIALAGIRDPIRAEVPKAVKKCQKAGIKVIMVTGDNKATATAIAKECNLLDSGSVIMEGKDFSEITGGTVCETCRTKTCPCPRNGSKSQRVDVVANLEKFKEISLNLSVLARSSPDDKYTLVTGLKQIGHVVAVTGDGTNDAPALKKADIGFAMGIAGTEMAKEAAGIILMDDNFNSIVRAVVWGRNVYDNIRSFVQFQLAVNVAVVGAVTIQQSPLSAVQLLWVNLIMDSLASLARQARSI